MNKLWEYMFWCRYKENVYEAFVIYIRIRGGVEIEFHGINNRPNIRNNYQINSYLFPYPNFSKFRLVDNDLHNKLSAYIIWRE